MLLGKHKLNGYLLDIMKRIGCEKSILFSHPNNVFTAYECN